MTEILEAPLNPRKEHVAGNEWRWVIHVGGIRVRRADVASVAYDAEGGGTLTLETDTDLRGMARSQVRVFMGYGDRDEGLTEWFSGDLAKPVYDPETGVTTVEAYGTLGAMGRQYWDTAVHLQGMSLRTFFGLVQSRLYDPRARMEVRSGDAEIEDTVFPGENSLRESAEAVIEGFDHVMRERPGFGLRATPRPRPAALSTYAAVFDESDYPPGQPKISPAGEGPYAKVVVYRRDDEGVEVVRAEAPVTNDVTTPPKPNEIYWVADFDGDQKEAQDTAAATARALAMENAESVTGTLTDIAPMESLFQDSPILLKRTEEESRSTSQFTSEREDESEDNHRRSSGFRRFRREYAATITDIEVDLVASNMTFSFDAIRTRDELIPRRKVPRAPSPYVIPAEGTSFETAFGEDSEGTYFRLGSAEDYAGYDANGFWVAPLEESGETGEDDGIYVVTSEASI